MIPGFDEVVSFHGHSCPGLAMGYRVAVMAMERLKSGRSTQQELVAVVENDSCAVDAVQYMTGCTFGKGNLIFRDYGKFGFTFFSRQTEESFRVFIDAFKLDAMQDFVRLNARNSLSEEEKQDRVRVRDESVRQILEMPEEELLWMTEPREVMPPKARIRSSGICKQCGERAMENRLTIVDDELVCRSCLNARSGLELR